MPETDASKFTPALNDLARDGLPGGVAPWFHSIPWGQRIEGILAAAVFMMAWAVLVWRLFLILKPYRKFITILGDGDGGVQIKVDWAGVHDQRDRSGKPE